MIPRGKKTYEGGCDFLLNWYKKEIQNNFGDRLKELELNAKAKPQPDPCLDIDIETVKELNATLKIIIRSTTVTDARITRTV